MQNKSRTIARNTEERFDSIAYKNKVKNNQVGPHSYNTYSQENLETQYLKPTNYKGKFPRDSSERLSSRNFIASKDVTPSPHETDTRFGTTLHLTKLNALKLNELIIYTEDDLASVRQT